MAVNLPDNPSVCDELAQKYGALAYVPDVGCCPVSGKEIKIEDLEHSVMEGFEITNFNFHCSGAQPALPSTEFLPGPVENNKKGMFV
jgi:hypothetical protein